MKSILKTVTLSVFFASAFLWAGEKGGNGGFAFNNAIQTLKFAQIDITEQGIDLMNQTCVNSTLAKSLLKPVDLARLSKIIKNTRRDFTKTVLGTDKNGEKQPLMLSYGIDEKGEYIVALQLYFIAFMGDSNSQRYPEASKLLLHEAAHLFGYNEREAAKFADIISELRENTTGDRPGDCWK